MELGSLASEALIYQYSGEVDVCDGDPEFSLRTARKNVFSGGGCVMKRHLLMLMVVLGFVLVLTSCSRGGITSVGQGAGASPGSQEKTDRGTQAVQESPGALGPGDNQEKTVGNSEQNSVQATGTADSQSQPVATDPSLKAVPVLYYHSVMVQAGNPLRMPPAQFEEQMSYLASHGYHNITPQQLEQFLTGQGLLPAKPFMITFDDGYTDNYTNALPILQRYKFAALVFMVSSYVDGSGYLSSSQLKGLVAAGWSIGGHTVTHVDLTKLDPSAQEKELRDSQAFLEKITGQPVQYFAYPFGAYNARIIEVLKQDGYRLAFTTERGWAQRGSNPFLIHRVYCYANMGLQEFKRRLENPHY